MQNNYPWWKYLNRPEMKYTEFQFLKDNLKSAKAIAIIDNGRSASATKGSSSMDVNMTGASYDYNQITSVPVQFGRYFLPIESENALNVVIIGAKVSENLQATVGDQIKLNGIKFQIIGIIEKKGNDLLSFGGTPDEKVFIPTTIPANLLAVPAFNLASIRAAFAIASSSYTSKKAFKALLCL